MIIRYGGGNSGIKEYLEDGRKMDRHFARDEMDTRIPIEGDLNITEAIYDSIEDKRQDRYLHITLSFNEPDITPEQIADVFQQYKKELMTAYKDDEFNIYAEIHWPKIKESYNHSSDTMEARYPHVHVVIPKRNLLTGGQLNPVGMHEHSVKYLDAIQEKLNRDNGLSSPRDNPRVGNNHYESALAKYKEKEFKSKNGTIKEEIYKAVIDRDIRSWDSFTAMLRERGDVVVRNAGKTNQYAAVKLPGDSKYTNLKGNIFNQAHIEQRSLVIDPITDAQVSKRVDTWHDIQSREIKFISNASAKVKSHYKSLSLPDRREFLTQRENQYEQRYREQTAVKPKDKLPRLPQGNYKSSDFEFARGYQAEATGYLHELRTRNVDYFGSQRHTANRLLLQGNEDDYLQHVPASGDPGLRRDLYAGSGTGRQLTTPVHENPSSSFIAALIDDEADKSKAKSSIAKYAEVRKKLDPQSFLAHLQVRYGIDPDQHKISRAKDGSPRISAGKYNYNVSDFLTKHIGLKWEEASQVLDCLYENQVLGNSAKPKSKKALVDDWRTFRNEQFPANVKTFKQLKNEIKITTSSASKSINSEYYSKRKAITEDTSLTRTQKHYFRSLVVLEKLQKIEALNESLNTKNRYKDKVKYPYSELFHSFVTDEEDFNMKVLDSFKKMYRPQAEEQVSPNSIGSGKPYVPANMPSGAEAAKRARLVAQLNEQEREIKEGKLKLGDLRPQPLASGAVAFTHKEHGKQIFVNHPDRLELNRVTEPDEVAVGLTYAVERFGSPLEIKGTKEFQEQVIQVTAERDMDITFTNPKLNDALAAKRQELGMAPLQNNTITVAELELDTSLPRDKAIDKALLESKVAELIEINSKPIDLNDSVTRRQLVNDFQERQEEITSDVTDRKSIADIALQDVATFKYLEGKPEQQKVALMMYETIQNRDVGQAYSEAITEHGPSELMLTIDATRFIQTNPNPEQMATVAPNHELEKRAENLKIATYETAKADDLDRSTTEGAKELTKAAEHELKNPSSFVEQLSQIEKIVAQSAVIEVNMRHEKMQSNELFGADVAKADLEAFANTRSQLEKNQIAISIDKMALEDSDYRDYVTLNAPHDLYVTIGAAHAEQDKKLVEPTPQHTNDHEM